jgi:hypothetical protein
MEQDFLLLTPPHSNLLYYLSPSTLAIQTSSK